MEWWMLIGDTMRWWIIFAFITIIFDIVYIHYSFALENEMKQNDWKVPYSIPYNEWSQLGYEYKKMCMDLKIEPSIAFKIRTYIRPIVYILNIILGITFISLFD